jgi:hypothetical protein
VAGELSGHVLLVPFVVVIASVVLALCLAPDIDTDAHYVAVGLLASGAGLSPSLSDDLYRVVFALSVAAGVGALLNVAVIGVSALTAAYAERDKEFEDQIRQLYAGAEALRRQPRP